MDTAAAPSPGGAPDSSGEWPEPPPYGPLPVGSTRRVWARRPADEAEAKAIASPLRLRILRVALHEPRTNKEIAEALGMNPASVLHHVRTLVDTGFLVEQPSRRGPRGSRERPYLASGKSYYMEMGDIELVGGQDLLLRTFLDEVAQLPPGAMDSNRLGFRLSPADRERVRDKLHVLLREIAAMPSDPDGEPWSLFLALHPDVSGVRSAHDRDPDGDDH
jgi:DNA-binding transcriptional ArsR family regulator